jgi:RNA polymerase sigma-70 factor, ECF subfamily
VAQAATDRRTAGQLVASYDGTARRPRAPWVDGRYAATVNVDDASAGDRLGSADAQRLVQEAAAGDHAAWEGIYRAVYPRLRAYASQHVGSDTADDVVSETMMRAVTSIDRFRWTPAGIEPWLFGIARRVVADHHRRTGRLRRWSRAVASPAPSLPADAVELADEHAAVRAAFSQLSARDRELLELRFIAGLTPDQAAAVLGKRPGAVRVAQSRALARLRQRLQRGPAQP